MSLRRSGLALAGALLTPWIGPHIDAYVPLGLVLWRAAGESPDPGFWVLAALLLVTGWLLWYGLISVAARWRR